MLQRWGNSFKGIKSNHKNSKELQEPPTFRGRDVLRIKKTPTKKCASLHLLCASEQGICSAWHTLPTVPNPTGHTLESPSRIPPAQIWGVLRVCFQTIPQQLLSDNIGLIPLLHSSQAAVPVLHQPLFLHVNSLHLQTSLGDREMADRINLHCAEKTNTC